MAQLIMRWKNDGDKIEEYQIPANCKIVNFTKLDDALNKWLDLVQYGLSNGRQNADFYNSAMTMNPNYSEDKCFFVLEDGKPVATLTVICDYEKKEGYIHMVACHTDARGKGYGSLLNKVAIETLKREGMKTAYLTTDDWRIPAIKSYLRVGFYPDRSTEDFQMRWDKIYKELGL